MPQLPRSPLAVLLIAAFLLGSGCAMTQVKPSDDHPVVTRLTLSAVKRLAVAEATKSGVSATASDPWLISVAVTASGLRWSAVLQSPDQITAAYQIDDLTGQVSLAKPTFAFAKGPIGPAWFPDWLVKLADALEQTKFPIAYETLMRTPGLIDAKQDGAGANEGLSYLEYIVHWLPQREGRIEVRCYYEGDVLGAKPTMINAVELAYLDMRNNRFILVDARPGAPNRVGMVPTSGRF